MLFLSVNRGAPESALRDPPNCTGFRDRPASSCRLYSVESDLMESWLGRRDGVG